MGNMLDECPHCGAKDLPFQQGPHLFLCPLCQMLYSSFEDRQCGQEGHYVATYRVLRCEFIPEKQ